MDPVSIPVTFFFFSFFLLHINLSTLERSHLWLWGLPQKTQTKYRRKGGARKQHGICQRPISFFLCCEHSFTNQYMNSQTFSYFWTLTQFFQSLDHRPRSIYDVLDHSAAKEESEQSKAKTKKKEGKERVSLNFDALDVILFVASWQRRSLWHVSFSLCRWSKSHKTNRKVYSSLFTRISKLWLNLF